ncbi:MAG: right-handed parallel beta-helix repeat-containing protein, partial [Planctomycetota bacterium]|nr:right-handed parallel beta-helix repeat-containing protein [Planctomycetota bacterium]
PSAAQDAPVGHMALVELPTIVVESDDTKITASCRIVIPDGLVIADANGDGVLHIEADGISVVFAPGSVLRGASVDTPLDQLTGVGIRVVGRSNVQLRGLAVEGFHAGLVAEDCEWLKIEDASFERHFAQRLASTPEREAAEDWLWPHANDDGEWLSRYGASVSITRSSHVELNGVTARKAQNGILLTRVQHSTVEACDASYLSGWGLAMWRSSDNRVLGNRFDYNVRGYSHGVYNRGQDSAGILAFEQCSRNLFLGNSATHCGDGFFGFSGKETLGEVGEHEADWYRRRGNNSNVFEGNDFSYAAAHGLELTFGFGNIVRRNVFRGNAICGIWGGYSQGTLIEDNLFAYNGDAGYGAERGGINIDHAADTTIRANRFGKNAAGVRLWKLASPFADTPWGRAQDLSAGGNTLVANTFLGDLVAVELAGPVELTAIGNSYVDVGTQLVADEAARFVESGAELDVRDADPRAGRESIRMTAWGPWDGSSPIATPLPGGAVGAAGGDLWVLDGFPEKPTIDLDQDSPLRVRFQKRGPDQAPDSWTLRVEAPGVPSGMLLPYDLVATSPAGSARLTGLVQDLSWTLAHFASPCDPIDEPERWREAARSAATTTHRGPLLFAYGNEGRPTPDSFGTFAETSVVFPAGRWRVSTTSDDGVRVLARTPDGALTTWIENWTHHGPTTDSFEVEFAADARVALSVEHFELTGYAWLELDFERLD